MLHAVIQALDTVLDRHTLPQKRKRAHVLCQACMQRRNMATWRLRSARRGAPQGGTPGSQAVQDGLQVRGAHVAAGGVRHAQALPALVQLAGDQATVEALADQQVLQLADVGYVQRRHEVRVRYHLAETLPFGQDMKFVHVVLCHSSAAN